MNDSEHFEIAMKEFMKEALKYNPSSKVREPILLDGSKNFKEFWDKHINKEKKNGTNV